MAVWAIRLRTRLADVSTRLSRLQEVDQLTNLPNRRHLANILTDVLQRSRKSAGRVAVIMIEIHGFKHFNETYGPEVGDALMRAATGVMTSACRPGETLARYGGPQFVLVVPEVPDPTVARRRAQELLDAVQRVYEIGRDRVRLSASAGVVVTDQQYTDANDVLLDASVALKDAQKEDPGTAKLFDHSMRSVMTPSTAEHRLREALERGQFWLLYMPIVSISRRTVVAVEALLRWADPDHGLVSPGVFLRALDETGLIVPVGRWVLREAARQTREWQEKFPEAMIETTVNLSPRQLAQSDFLDTVRQALEESSPDPARMCLEITEATLVRDPDGAWAVLRQAKQMGLRLGLDDFGTGTSALAMLRQFKLDNLKIARTFTANLEHSAEDRAIVSHVAGLARELGMKPIAEGVERRAQADLLVQLGCDHASGYYFAPPQPSDVITKLLEKGTVEAGKVTAEFDPAVTRATIVRPDLD